MYERNSDLRAAGEEIEYTKEMIEEYIRCKEDIFYFAEKYFYIISLDDGRVLIPLREYQKKNVRRLLSQVTIEET